MDVAAFRRCVGKCYVSPAFRDFESLRFQRLSLSSSLSPDPTGNRGLKFPGQSHERRLSFFRPIMATDESISSRSSDPAGETKQIKNGKQKNIVWHDCSITKSDRQELINQKGCVIWITGLSGSGKSSLAPSFAQSWKAFVKVTMFDMV